MSAVNSTISEDIDLRYPIGKFEHSGPIDARLRGIWIEVLRAFPNSLRAEVIDLTPAQLETPYRPDGWTVRQVVHHVADSHVNSYARFRLALTEESPSIRTYHEELWAQLVDAQSGPIEPSLQILDGLHSRWTLLLASLQDEDFRRAFHHPEWKEVPLDRALGMYAWHSTHHLAHIQKLKLRLGW